MIVNLSATIAAEPAIVYGYLTDPARYVRWMGTTATLDPEPGGAYRVRMADGFEAVGTFLDVQPPRRLSFTWGWAPGSGRRVLSGGQRDDTLPPGSSRVSIALDPQGRRTRVTLQHDGLPTLELVDNHRIAWRTYLGRLRVCAEGGDPGPDPHTGPTTGAPTP